MCVVLGVFEKYEAAGYVLSHQIIYCFRWVFMCALNTMPTASYVNNGPMCNRERCDYVCLCSVPMLGVAHYALAENFYFAAI